MVGSMGCALSIGIGLAIVRPEKKICVIDGDGALMMRMGSMVLPAQLGLKNLKHILLDNEVHDSTGGQFSGSKQVAFSQIALGSGYQSIIEANGVAELKNALESSEVGPSFIHCKIFPGSPKELGRPKVTPEFVALRFKESIN
jgi:phosphonopyruvate decarboxylase